MSTVALALILVSAGIHATWNLFAKRLPGGAEGTWLFTTISTVAFAPLVVVVVIWTGYRPDGRDWIFLLGTGVLQTL